MDHSKYAECINELKENCLLSLKSCDAEVQSMLADVRIKSALYLDILEKGIQPEHYTLNKNCHSCEFRIENSTNPNGYRECMGSLADPDPHIFDLYYGGALGHHTKGFYLDELIRQNQTTFNSFDTTRFYNVKGELGPRGERQLLQYQHTIAGTEYQDPRLCEELNALKYPLHFIDFETYMSALPHHAGMRTYEKIAFQWSCHTLESPGAELKHSEFLNDQSSFPNFTFATTLMETIGDSGTPFMWSAFENTTLRQILEQMDVFGFQDDNLKEWLLRITKDKSLNRPGRFTDMNELCLKYYFHPEMKGRTSIKKVLPAIWTNAPWLREDPWFEEFVPLSGDTLNPYDSLAHLVQDLEEKEVVDDGTGAMMAYHDMMYGPLSNDPARQRRIRQSLLNYCKLDTMAMVMIWKYWTHKA